MPKVEKIIMRCPICGSWYFKRVRKWVGGEQRDRLMCQGCPFEQTIVTGWLTLACRSTMLNMERLAKEFRNAGITFKEASASLTAFRKTYMKAKEGE